MEFAFEIERVLPGRITIIENKDSEAVLKIYDLELRTENKQEVSKSWLYAGSSNVPWNVKTQKRKEQLEAIIDRLGQASAQAQNLHPPITTLKKLTNSPKQKIYTIRDLSQPRCIIGMLKVGTKRLFVSDDLGAHHEVDPLCLLDFYIHESVQRCGFGHELFDAMLQAEGVHPVKLAIDRPSFKCLAFLEKHYNLKKPSQQNNNFVIYPGFLADRPVTRPPIFLYNGRVLKRASLSSIKKTTSSPCNDNDSVRSLDSVHVPLSAKEMKSKLFYSSTGNFLNWNDSDGDLECNGNKKTGNHRPLTRRLASYSYCNGSEKNWGVHEAMHSYSKTQEALDDCGQSEKCAMTPVTTESNCDEGKWNQLQSSWNIFGVKPLYHTNALKH